ncbi:MAG: phosphomannomutase/phosphoglucomutase [Eubacterium sp.]|nr:phosphomannomutase/phosphoglucomutase [Eubacterium sp.]
MLDNFYKNFKSGTDIRGVASEGVEGQNVNLTDDVVKKMAFGFVLWLEKVANKKASEMTISVGRDSRISGERIANDVIDSFKKAGVKVIYTNLSSTPSMFMTTVDLGCDGAVQITASHHPFNRNGLKFFTPNGGLEASDIEEILQYAQDDKKPEITDNGTVEEMDYMLRYSNHLCDIIKKGVNAEDYDHPLKGFKIVVDAGNGVGGFYADKVLKVLGADTEGSVYLDPDGMFPNHIPNPEDKTAMESISKAVLDSKADLGVIFDTDVDRGGAVDSFGKEINRNRLVALASAIALEGTDGGTIVTDSVTSSGLKDFIENHLGGKHYRYRRGYKNVIDKAIELNANGMESPLAIETSGHAALKENYFLDDGAYLAVKIVILLAKLSAQGKSIDSLISTLREPAESVEIRIPILLDDFKEYGENVISSLRNHYSEKEGFWVEEENYEGVRINFKGGWFLLRLSVHDPILPLNIESDCKGVCSGIARDIKNFLSAFEKLDLSNFDKVL